MTADSDRLCAIEVDSGGAWTTDRVAEADRDTAISDILESSSFGLVGHEVGPYRLALSIFDGKLVLNVSTRNKVHVVSHVVSFTPFRRIMREYAMICEAYYSMAAELTVHRMEAIDMGRRAIHNEGAELLRERLSAKVRMDLETARRLFTLIIALTG